MEVNNNRGSRAELRKSLKGMLLENIVNKHVVDQVKSDMLALGVLNGTTQDIFNQRIVTEQLSDDVLYFLSKSLFKTLESVRRESDLNDEQTRRKNEMINPSNHFTKEEIEEIKLLQITKLSNESKKIPYTIPNVINVARDHKVVFMKAKDLVELYNRGLIRYRIETQRQPTIIKSKFDGTLIKTPTINDNSVEEIKEELVKGTFITNYITLNSIKPDSFKYNENTGTLEVLDILDVADGAHRSLGMIKALSEGDIDYITGVNITSWDTNKILKFIEQEDKKNKMSVRFVKTLNRDKKSNIVVEQINLSPNSDLNGKIVTDIRFIQEGKALTLTDVMQEGIDRYFKLNSMSDVQKVRDYLISGYNKIMGMEEYQDIFINELRKSKRFSLMAHENMFLVHMYILKKIRDTDNYDEELKFILKSVDFSTENSAWEEMGMLKPTISKKSMDKMEAYINQFI